MKAYFIDQVDRQLAEIEDELGPAQRYVLDLTSMQRLWGPEAALTLGLPVACHVWNQSSTCATARWSPGGRRCSPALDEYLRSGGPAVA